MSGLLVAPLQTGVSSMHILETELSRERTRQTASDLESIRLARRLRSARRKHRADRRI